jgi:hypothetical protein
MTGQTTHTSIIYGLELHVRIYVSSAWSWILFSSLYFLKARLSYHDQIYIFLNFLKDYFRFILFEYIKLIQYKTR